LLWKVNGKWNPDALVLLKIEDNRLKWHIDLLRTAQEAVLVRTRDAAPEQYLGAKTANSGNGRAFPDGFYH
jgi:Uri superfamily endonuclease